MLDNNLKVSEKENQTCRIWCEYIPTKDKESECLRNNYIYNVERNKQTYDNRKPNDRKMSSLTHDTRIEFSIFWFTELSLLKYKFSIKIK